MLILDYDYEMDIAVQREEAAREGHQEGLAQGRQAGIERGIEQGLEQGIQQGVEQEKLKSAKKLKELGDDLEKIAVVTGLSIQEIEAL